MKIFNEAITWLTTKKESSVTDATATTAADTTAATTDAETTTAATPVAATTAVATSTEPSTDSVLSKVKELLINIGHDVDTEWDELVALAKKLVTKSS